MSASIERLHLPSKSKLKEQLQLVDTSLLQIKDALAACQEIQNDYVDKKLTTIEDLQTLRDELEKTAKGQLFEDFMES